MTTLTTAPGTASEISAGRLLARTCAAEWTRLWTVRGTWWFLAAAVAVMVGIGTVAGFGAANDPTPPKGDPAWEIVSVTAMPAQFALLALVLLAVTSDYATGGIVPTLQWTPRRGALFLARTGVPVGVATGIGVLAGLGAAVAGYGAARPHLTLPLHEGAEALGTVALVVGCGTAFAVGLGFLLRSTAGALATAFLLMLLLPLFLPQFPYAWMAELAQVLPGTGAAFLLLGEVPGMTTTSSVVVLLCWAAGTLLLGWLRFSRSDANR